MKNLITHSRIGVVVLSLCALLGCGKEKSVDRISVSGTITYKGQPVSEGFVCFTPDPRKGNRGPQGVAKIVEGFYSTEKFNGKGSVVGPQIIEIRGFGGSTSPSGGDAHPFVSGQPLFPPYFSEVDISHEVATYDFEVVEEDSSTKEKSSGK